MAKKRYLVADWRKAWTWYSQWANAANVAVTTTWIALPEDMRAAFPPKYLAGIVIVLLVASSLGRIIKQEK